jgi:fatty-acyl-CoA synthase
MSEAEIRRARRNMVGDALRRAATVHRERPALHFADRDWSFSDLDRAASRVAVRLLDSGLRRGERVVTYGRNSDAYLLAWLGCLRAGVVHVPVNFTLSTAELGYILRQCGASLLLHDPALGETAAAAAREVGLARRGTLHGGDGLDILAGALAPGDAAPPDVGEDTEVAQIIYTSGTTGAPKGAALAHDGIMAQYMSVISAMEFAEVDRCLAALPLYHVAQMHAFTMPQLIQGAETWLLESPVPEQVLALIERHRINSFFAPPTVWINLLRHPDFATRDLASLRNVYYGAAIMPVAVLAELRARLPGVRPFNCYGQSEMAPLATVLRPEEHDARPASVGRPVCSVETRIVDAQMRDVPAGQQGEIVHRSPHLLVGYWDKPEETARAFEGGWFHSGDIGVMDAQGYITVVDRLKDVINTGGVLVASREVEEALFTHPAVSEVAVIAVPDAKWIEAIAAVVVLRQGMSATAEELVAHARERLAPYKLPKQMIFAETLPKNTAGKLLKRELRAIYAGTPSGALGHEQAVHAGA